MTRTNQLFLAAAFLAVILFSSCDPTVVLGPQAGNADNYNLRVKYHRGACYGRCEVYTLEMYDNGLLLFKGERFTERPGVWQKNIDRRRVTSLLDSFERADFENYPLSFRSQVPDAPTTEVTYYDDDGKAYKTAFKEYAPAELEALAMAVKRLAELEGYRQVSEDIPESTVRPRAQSEREEIIVQLVDGVSAEAWIVAYGKQNAQVLRRISPNSSYYVITADPNMMPASELLEFLRKDKSVLSAQANGKVEQRN
jgi:hypothetical protein